MKAAIVIIGIGEIGSVFARGFLKLGHPVYPITRDMDIEQVAQQVPEPQLVLVTVGESDLASVLATLPEQWKNCTALIQNELLPSDWQQHNISNPTVASIWFEKKQGQEPKVVVASPVYGSQANLIKAALDSLQIPCNILASESELLFELVRKNYYILASNICGLKTGGVVSELWQKHEAFVREVLSDIHAIQEHLAGQNLDKEALLAAMLIAFEGDPEHGCMGRSAPARLERALKIAKQANIDVPHLDALQAQL